MASAPRAAAIIDDAPEHTDLGGVERILAHCRGVVHASRTLHAAWWALHARYSENAASVARTCRRLGRAAPRLRPPACVRGGSGALDGTRVMLVTHDPDTRDLIGLVLKWYGAEVAAVAASDLRAFVDRFRPDVVVIDLPFVRDGVFTLARGLRAECDGNGSRPRLVALTKHQHDHPESDALQAGFDLQIAEPIDPSALEQILSRLLRSAA